MPSGSINGILTHRFRNQYNEEDDALTRGEIHKVAGTGLLPVEVIESSCRQPLAIHDLKLGFEVTDIGLGHFPFARAKVATGYEEG